MYSIQYGCIYMRTVNLEQRAFVWELAAGTMCMWHRNQNAWISNDIYTDKKWHHIMQIHYRYDLFNWSLRSESLLIIIVIVQLGYATSFITPRAHAQQGVKWLSLSFCLYFCLSFCKKILRWRELATFRTSERIRRFENTPIYLPVPATGLTRSHSLGFLLFSYYLVHFVSHFVYGHQSCPQIICHVYTYIYAHARAQKLTLHSGSVAYALMAIWRIWQCRARGVCALVSSSCTYFP